MPLPSLLAASLLATVPKVTLHERAQPLSLLLPKLSAQVDRRLEVNPALAREWLVVDVKDADPEELLARIAEVTHAEWIQEGGEWRLKRSTETERRLAAEERAAHAESLRSQWTQALRAPFDPAALARRRRDARLQEPGGDGDLDPKKYPNAGAVLDHYMIEILLQIPIETIVSLPDRRGFVMSNAPRGSQRPLPASTAPLVNRLIRDYEAYAAILRPLEPEEYSDLAPVRVKFSVSAHRITPTRARFFAQLSLLDERGKVISNTARPFSAPPVLPAPPGTSSKPFSPGEPAIELERVLQKRVPFAKAPDAVRDQILQPEREGRLSQLWSDVMFALAARESRSLVANLPDVAELYGMPTNLAPAPLDTYVNRLTIVEFHRDGGWLTVRPRYPGPAGRFRADRGAVGWAVRTVAAGKSISLEEGAQVENRLGRSRWPMWTRHDCVDPTGGAAITSLDVYEPGHDILRLLPSNQLAALYEGRPLPFGTLPTALQTALRELYLQSGAYAILVVPDREGEPESGEGVELTDVLGPAQVAGLVIRARVSEEIAFIGRSSAAPEARTLLTPSAMFRYLDDDLRARKSVLDESGETEVVYNEFQIARTRKVDITVHFPNGYRQDVPLEDHRFNAQDPFVSPSRFPKPILDYLRKLRQETPTEGTEDGQQA